MLGTLFLGLLLPRLMLAFGGEDPALGKPFYHDKITREEAAAAEAGWSDDTPDDSLDGSAIDALAWHADYVDSYLYNWVWNAGGGEGRVKAALFAHDDLVKVHFDDLTSTAQVELMWSRYLGGTVAGLLWAAERGDVAAGRQLVGVSLHALQDFYSHSNWVDDPARRGNNLDHSGTWFDFTPDQRAKMSLFTGTYELADHQGFKHHSKIAIDCKLMHEINNVLPVDTMDLLCGALSPLNGTALCRRWRECKQNSVPAHPDVVLGVDVPDSVVYLGPPGIALDSEWMSQVNVVNRDLPELGQPGFDNKKKGRELFTNATDLARRHTRQWLAALDEIMAKAGHQVYWTSVKTRTRQGGLVGPVGFPILEDYLTTYAEDAHQYEHKNKLPLSFLSAGKYPPSPLGADEGWYVRLQIRTADDEFGPGTNSDIDVEIGGKFFRLDRGSNQNRLLEFNDFEDGDDTFYVVGPFAEVPTSMRLINNGTSLLDLIAAALADLAELVTDLLEDIGTFLLSLVGGNADYVGSDKMVWNWDELQALVGEEFERDFVWSVDGGSEGKYDVIGRILVEQLPNGSLQVRVRPRFLDCIEESSGIADADETPSEDEITIMMILNSPASGQLLDMRTPIIRNLDSGERHGFQVDPLVVEVPRHGGLIAPIQLWESDLETAEKRDELQREFRRLYDGRTESSRSAFLDALGEAVLPDWKVRAFDAVAYRRGAVTQLVSLAENQQVNRWIEAGRSLTLDFTPQLVRSVEVPALLPAVDTVPITPGSVNGVAVGPDGVTAVTAFGTGASASGQVRRFGLHVEPGPTAGSLPPVRSVAVDPERQAVYALHGNGTLAMYRTEGATMSLVTSVSLGFGTIDVAVDPGAGLLFVSVTGTTAGRIIVLSADDLAERSRYTEPDGFLGAHGLAVASDPRQLLVARTFRSGGPGAPTVTQLSTLDIDPVAGVLSPQGTFSFADPLVQPIDVASNGASVYLACLGANSPGAQPRLTVLSREGGLHPVGELVLPSPVRAVASRPGSPIAYVVGESGLMFVDTQLVRRVLTVPLGRQPHAVAVDPETGVAYVGDRLDGTLSRVSLPTGLV